MWRVSCSSLPGFVDIMIKLWRVMFERQGIGQDRDNEETW